MAAAATNDDQTADMDGGSDNGIALGGGDVLAAATTGSAKRYRAAPAKTFQCRGYGECRMVFSRSEHLARHVR